MAMSVVIAKWKELQNAKWCFLAKLHANKQNQAKAWQIMWNRGDCVFIEPGSNTSLSYSFLIFFHKDRVTCATLCHALTTFSTSVTSVGRPCSGPEAVQGRLHVSFLYHFSHTRSDSFLVFHDRASARNSHDNCSNELGTQTFERTSQSLALSHTKVNMEYGEHWLMWWWILGKGW